MTNTTNQTNGVNTHPFFALTADLGPTLTITAAELKSIDFNPRSSMNRSPVRRIRDNRVTEKVMLKPTPRINVNTSLHELKEVLHIAFSQYARLKMRDITSLILVLLPEQSMKAQARQLPTEVEFSQFDFLVKESEKTSSENFFRTLESFTTDQILFLAEIYNSEIERVIRDVTFRLNVPTPESEVARTNSFQLDTVMRDTQLKDIREMFPQIYPVFDSLVLREYKIDRTLMNKEELWSYAQKQTFVQSLFDYGIFGQVFLYEDLTQTVLLNAFRRFEALKDFVSGEFPIKADGKLHFFVEKPELFTNVLMRIVFPVTTLSFGTNMKPITFGDNELTALQRSIQNITP